MDKLPKVFQNPINKKIDNDQRCFVSFDNNLGKSFSNKSVNLDDIDNILNDRHRISKPAVKIITTDDVIQCKIVSRNNDFILTMDNRKIPINKIKNIEIN